MRDGLGWCLGQKTRGMTHLIGISGSLRKASFNSALLRAAADVLPDGVTFTIASIRDIPFYDGDVEATSGIPEPVRTLKDEIAAADAVMLCTPEYNNSIPGVMKNAIDWLSRPPSDIPRVFYGKPIAVLGASTGNFGTVLSQNAWLSVLRTLRTEPWFGGRMAVARAAAQFDGEGKIVNEELRMQLRDFVAGFVAFVRARKPLF